MPEKVRWVQDTPVPSSEMELKAYLGLLNYYHRFLPNLSSLVAPLHKLLSKKEPWFWGTEQEKAFKLSKGLVQSSRVLVHYDDIKELIFLCDVSHYVDGSCNFPLHVKWGSESGLYLTHSHLLKRIIHD